MTAARILVACGLVASCGRVRFDDALDATIDGTSTLALALVPATATINTGSHVQLIASGGTEPYTFDLAGEGWIDPALGRFTAPSAVGKTIVRVTDAANETATAEVTYRGSTIFVVGGLVGGNAVASVYSSTDGLVWNQISAIPAPRANGALVVLDDFMLLIGGTQGSVPQTSIYSSRDGVTWSSAGTLAERIVSTAVIMHEGALLMISGYEGTGDHTEVRRSTDGITWTTVGTLPSPRHEHDAISRDGKLWVFGGHGAAQYDDVWSSIDDGVTWQQEPITLNFATDFQGFGQLGDRAVRVCGVGCGAVEVSDDLVTWTAGTLPAGGRDGPDIVTLDGRLVLFGGGPTEILGSTDGLAWTPAGTFPINITRSSAAVFTPQ